VLQSRSILQRTRRNLRYEIWTLLSSKYASTSRKPFSNEECALILNPDLAKYPNLRLRSLPEMIPSQLVSVTQRMGHFFGPSLAGTLIEMASKIRRDQSDVSIKRDDSKCFYGYLILQSVINKARSMLAQSLPETRAKELARSNEFGAYLNRLLPSELKTKEELYFLFNCVGKLWPAAASQIIDFARLIKQIVLRVLERENRTLFAEICSDFGYGTTSWNVVRNLATSSHVPSVRQRVFVSHHANNFNFA
jgi:hypothetical protein